MYMLIVAFKNNTVKKTLVALHASFICGIFEGKFQLLRTLKLNESALLVLFNLIAYLYNPIGALDNRADNCRFSADGVFENSAEFCV